MKNFKTTLAFVTIFMFSLTFNASAGLIDFETVPGGSPADALAISNQYQALHGVTFSWTGGTTTTPYLEQTGGSDPNKGFVNNGDNGNAGDDIEASGFEGQLGGYFLRLGNGGLPGAAQVGSLRIDYDNAVSGASAEIWDIDWAKSQGTEQWLVQAFGASGLLGSETSPLGDDMTLDGKPWTWSFNFNSNQIEYITVSFTGSKTTGIGLAFDNFNTDSAAVPIPGAVWLLGSGLLGLFGVRRKKM